MGCNPFGRMISMGCGRKSGGGKSRSKKRRSRWDEQDEMHVGYMSPTSSAGMSSYGHTMVKSVIYSDSVPKMVMHSHDAAVVSSSSCNAWSGEMPAGAEETRHLARDGKTTAGHQPQKVVTVTTPVGVGGVASDHHRYMMPSPTPLPAYHVDGREYFGGDYHYYPTPIREGIYRLATDSNRLTNIFSDENPNACSIV